VYNNTHYQQAYAKKTNIKTYTHIIPHSHTHQMCIKNSKKTLHKHTKRRSPQYPHPLLLQQDKIYII